MSDRNNQIGNSNKYFSKAEPREIVCRTRINTIHNQSPWIKFSGPFYVSFSYVSLKNV